MVILLNTECCGGEGIHKWERTKSHILNFQTEIIHANKNNTPAKLEEYLENGETHFVAAGGDGTVNYLLNNLINTASPNQIKNVIIGAVGIGSSNDFHKPFDFQNTSIPIANDFEKSYSRDVGKLTYETDKGKINKYFLINASIGITAQANYLFNNPDPILKILKRFNTKLAIIYAAFKTILTYRNVRAKLYINGDSVATKITNIGIVKNPHFSGDFCYDSETDYSSGFFDVHLAYQMNKFEILNLMKTLTQNRFPKLKKTKSWKINQIKIESEKEFAVEYDGEIIETKNVEFTVLNNFIKVCRNGKSIRS